jgi:hypothetical protein|mmetsp:Transcript_14320/g.21565  ORF Transcript_14320/g.21565 Transcript_14320/m.21565 type:complete len:164 (-) Transcript_14320:122-613(-)
MKRSIFMYLFLFAALWVVFQYVNNVKVYENQESRIEKLQTKLEEASLRSDSLSSRMSDAEYFTIKGNENAYTYFENDGLDLDVLVPKIMDGMYAKTTVDGNDLIPFEGTARPFQINNVQLLNHRWLIADFSDGDRWGEILVQYFINEDGTMDYETIESLVYPE